MLIQLYRDNYIEFPREALTYRIYSGYFNGVVSWFDTATLLYSGETSNLTNLQTATNNQFPATNSSLKITGYFRAKQTGNYRFFTVSKDASLLYIDNTALVSNNGNTSVSNTINMTAGQYYKIDIYYGISTTGIPSFSAGFDFVKSYPPKPFTSDNNLVVSDFAYGNGTYSIDRSSIITGYNAYRAFDKTSAEWISTNIGNYSSTDGSYIGSASTTLTNNTSILGEWIQIKLPSAIVLNSFLLRARNALNFPRTPKSFVIVGRNESNNWTKIFETSNVDSLLVNDADGVFTANETIFLNPTTTTAYTDYRLIVRQTALNAINVSIAEWELYEADDQPPITNATSLSTYFNINPEDTTSLVESSSNYPLTYLDGSLYGLFRVSPLALYINRSNFTTSKHDILYVASEDLFNNFNGTYKDYIQLQEKPIANDLLRRKKFTQFSSDMSFECELNGKIEVRFRRGNLEPVDWRYAMLILDVERIPIKKL